MEMESVAAQITSTFMTTLPAQMIKVEKTQRVSRCETIVEESSSGMFSLLEAEEECVASLETCGELAPAPVITVRRPSFRSSLDTIWEDTMQYVAEYFVSDAILRSSSPALRSLAYSEASDFSNQFCIDSSRRGASSRALNFDRLDQLVN